jgi:gamma-glutamylputrescine oxidase
VQVFEQTPVGGVRAGAVEAAGHRVTAGHVVLCADRWLPDLWPVNGAIGQVQTFLAISEPLPDDAVRRVFPGDPVMAWDSKLTYNYFRLTGDQRLLVGGANLWHTYALRERDDPVRNARPLTDFVARTFRGLEVPWSHVWPGMLGVSKDFLPVAGTDADAPSVTFIGAAAGLPWAAALGRQVGMSIASGAPGPIVEFSPQRHTTGGAWLGRVLTTRGGLAVAHGLLAARDR